MKTSLKTYVTFLIDKITLFFTLTLLIIVCAVYFGNQENTEKMTEFINSNSYANKAMQVDSLTEFEFQTINNWLPDFYNSSVYKIIGQVPLNKSYINKNLSQNEPIYYFNSEYYKQITSDKDNKKKIYAKKAEYKLGDYLVTGLCIYSTDNHFKDDNKILLSFPYLRVNPKIKIKQITIENLEDDFSLDMILTLDINNLEKIEKESLKNSIFSSYGLTEFNKEIMTIKVYLYSKREIKESKITEVN